MGRRSKAAIEAAAAEASEAARVLQQRGQEAKNAKSEERLEPSAESSDNSSLRPVRARNEVREKAMEEIYRHREELPEYRQAEGSTESPEEKKEEVVEAKQGAEEPKETPETTETPEVNAESTEATEVKEELVQVKVDGEVFQVPKAEVEEAGGLKAYQITKAAEKRLERLKELERQVRNEQIARQQEQQRQIQAAQQSNQQQMLQQVQARFQQLRELALYGEPEQAFAAQIEMNRLMSSLQQRDPIPQEDRAVIKTRMFQARDVFNKEFPEIAQDPDLLEIAANWENKELQKMTPQALLYNDWENFYRGLGNKMRAKMGGAKPATQTAQTTGNTTQPSDKEARKASIVSLPSAAARAATPKEDKPETREDILNEMKKARGLPLG